MKTLLVLWTFVCLFSLTSAATILPPNNFAIYDDPHKIANIDKDTFDKICDTVVALWQPYAELHHAKLVVNKLWDDSTVNASASQSGNVWTVNMYGGLARRPEITQDGFALVVCHELGHHFGGHFFYESDDWAAAEGQADYFATHVCGRRVFGKQMAYTMKFRSAVPSNIQAQCDAVYKTQPEQEVCYREAAGGISLATLLAVIGGSRSIPKIETPDPSKVRQTNTAHPEAQCRLDTYFQGALCAKVFDLKTIPGKEMGANANNSKKAELEAAQYSCFMGQGEQVGNRPACWFKQQN
jgi:hypothetical protein